MHEIVLQKEKPVIVVWFSCGAASAVAAKKTLEIYGNTHTVLIVNNPVIEEHPDNFRFLLDVQKWLKTDIFLAGNVEFPENSAVVVWDRERYMSGVKGAPCTKFLKRQARYNFEKLNNIAWHVLGYTKDELARHNKFITRERENVIPVLISENLTKEDCFKIIQEAGIKLPEIYGLGYPNANCIGCVKATSATYWNHVRKTFPDIFEARASQSRRIGARLVRYQGKRLFLDELPETAIGRKLKSFECSIFCQS